MTEHESHGETMGDSYWQTREGRINQAIREGLRDAGVKGPLVDLVGPIVRAVLRELDALERQDD